MCKVLALQLIKGENMKMSGGNNIQNIKNFNLKKDSPLDVTPLTTKDDIL